MIKHSNFKTISRIILPSSRCRRYSRGINTVGNFIEWFEICVIHIYGSQGPWLIRPGLSCTIIYWLIVVVYSFQLISWEIRLGYINCNIGVIFIPYYAEFALYNYFFDYFLINSINSNVQQGPGFMIIYENWFINF